MDTSTQWVGWLISVAGFMTAAAVVVWNVRRQLALKAITDVASEVWDTVSALQMELSTWRARDYDQPDIWQKLIEVHRPRLLHAFRRAQLLLEVEATNHIHDIIADVGQMEAQGHDLWSRRRQDPVEAVEVTRHTQQLNGLEERVGDSCEALLTSLQTLIHPLGWVERAAGERLRRHWYRESAPHRPALPPPRA